MATKSNELQELIDSLKNATFVPKTQEELQQQAQNRYQSYYDQQRLSAQQEYERNAAALESELAGLGATYDKQRKQSQKAYAQSYSQADRNMLSKGMQRSSYGAQTLANIQTAGNEALQEIAEQEAYKRESLAKNQTLLAQQLSSQLKQYDANQAADILAYLDELEAQEYEREQQSIQYNNQLSAQIYEYLMAEQERDAEAERWQKEFELALKQYEDSKKKSSSNYNPNPPATNPPATDPAPTDKDLIDTLSILSSIKSVSSALDAASTVVTTPATPTTTTTEENKNKKTVKKVVKTGTDAVTHAG